MITAFGWSTCFPVPDEVTDLITTNANFTTIELSWHHPSVPHNRDCVFYYEVCYQLSSSKAVPICLTTEPITEFVNPFNYALEYLEPCSSYYVTITPITPSLRKGRLAPLVTRTLDDGEKAESEDNVLVLSIHLLFFSVPGAPQTLTVTNGQNGCVSLDWEPPATNANCVTGYSIGCRRLTNFNELMNGQVLQSDETSGTECGLLSCTTYDCYVVALGLTSLSESTFENITTTMSTRKTLSNLWIDIGAVELSCLSTWTPSKFCCQFTYNNKCLAFVDETRCQLQLRHWLSFAMESQLWKHDFNRPGWWWNKLQCWLVRVLPVLRELAWSYQ